MYTLSPARRAARSSVAESKSYKAASHLIHKPSPPSGSCHPVLTDGGTEAREGRTARLMLKARRGPATAHTRRALSWEPSGLRVVTGVFIFELECSYAVKGKNKHQELQNPKKGVDPPVLDHDFKKKEQIVSGGKNKSEGEKSPSPT